MTRRPRLLDLFCGAGGAAKGYQGAGFDVVGVDIKPQPRYPFEFHQGDALEYALEHGHEFDAIHASPPCQGWCRQTGQHRDKHPLLICATRLVVSRLELPYVLENIEDARFALRNPVKLCGSQFGLPIHRHRYFEVYPELPLVLLSPCGVDGPAVYITGTPRPPGGGRRMDPPAAVKRVAMGTPWMTIANMDEAIPPAFTEFIGRQLRQFCIATPSEAEPAGIEREGKL